MPDFNEILHLDYWRERKIAAVYIALGVVLFIIFAIGGFPYDRALTGTLAPIGLQLSYSGQRARFPIGSVLEDVRLEDLSQPHSQPLFQSEELALSPGFGTLIGRPTLNVAADAYDGIADVALRHSSEITGLYFNLQGIRLERYPLAMRLRMSVRGVLNANGDLEIADRTRMSKAGTLTVAIRGFAVDMGRGLPHVAFNHLQGNAVVHDGVVTIQRLNGDGPDAGLALHGTIHLAPTVAATMVDLTLELQPTAVGRAHLGFLLNFLPHPPNGRPYTIRGSLAAPTLG